MKVKECRYCDSTLSGHLYGKDEPLCCLTCGAEWEPVDVEYPDNYFDDMESEESE